MSDTKNMKLFALNSNKEIAQKIADAAGVPLGRISSRQFSAGEIQVNIGNLVSIKTKEGLERNILSVFAEFMATLWTILIGHIKS